MGLLANYPTLSQDWLKHELDPRLFRKQVTVLGGSGDVITGTVVGKVTASGKYVPLAPAASDGSQTAAGVVLHRVDATGADVAGVIVTGNAEILPLYMNFGAATAPQVTAALAQLAALGFQTRQVA